MTWKRYAVSCVLAAIFLYWEWYYAIPSFSVGTVGDVFSWIMLILLWIFGYIVLPVMGWRLWNDVEKGEGDKN